MFLLGFNCKEFVLPDTKKGGAGNGQGGPGMPDPINALQTLASQGTRNNNPMMGMGGPQSGPMGGPQQMPPITASNLLQTLNRPGQNMSNIQVRQGMGMVPNNGPMQNSMGGQMQGQMSGQLTGQLTNQMQGQMNAANMNQLQGQISNQLQAQLQGQVPGQLGKVPTYFCSKSFVAR